jgi:phage shock protein E
MDAIKKMLGFGPKLDYAELLKKGAIILDVRSKAEFESGHVEGSINIPVDKLSDHVTELPKDKPIITCCASGIRSAKANRILTSNGFKELYNGGGCMSLQDKIN